MPRAKKQSVKSPKRRTSTKKQAPKTASRETTSGSTNRTYELTVVVSPQVKVEKRKLLVDGLKKQLVSLKGSVVKVDEWGLKDLSYPIARELTGWYAQLEIKLPPQAPVKLEEKLKRDEEIIRHLLVKKLKPKTRKAKSEKAIKKLVPLSS